MQLHAYISTIQILPLMNIDHHCRRRKAGWSPGNDNEFIILPFSTYKLRLLEMSENKARILYALACVKAFFCS